MYQAQLIQLEKSNEEIRSLRSSLSVDVLSVSMQILKNLESHPSYIQKYLKDVTGKSLHATPIGKLYHSLMAPLRDKKAIHIHIDDIKIRELDHSFHEQYSHLVNWGYNRRYKVSDGDYIPLALPQTLHSPHTIKTFIATTTIGQEEIILSTISVVEGKGVEVFELYQVPRSIQRAGKVAELKRFAKHPLFDVLAHAEDETLQTHSHMYARLILRKIWRAMGQHMEKYNLKPYYILAPHVKNWFDSAGVGPIELVSETTRQESPKYQQLLSTFPHYWQKKPAVYSAPHFPKPITLYPQKIYTK